MGKMDEETRPVARVERSAASVSVRPVERLHKFSLRLPDANPFWNEPLLGDPNFSIAGDGQPLGIIHVEGIVLSDPWPAWLANRAKQPAVLRERLNLVTVS